MFHPLLTKQQQEVVVFPVVNTLLYSDRLLIGFHLIAAGFLLQYFWFSSPVALGFSFFLIFIGNLLFIVKGYDNRIKFGKFAADAAWELVSDEKIAEIDTLTKRIKQWDRNWLDLSNRRGGFLFTLFCGGVIVTMFRGIDQENLPLITLAADAFLLTFPHFVMGQRSTQTQPNLTLKIKLFKKLTADKHVSLALSPHTLEYLLLLQTSDERRYPSDVKIRISLANQPAHLLGLYGQIVMNRVGDAKYPYFYVVIVTTKNSGLKRHFETYTPPRNTIKEYKTEGEVDVLVLRQTTTSASGYHTPHSAMRNILIEGVKLAEKVVAE